MTYKNKYQNAKQAYLQMLGGAEASEYINTKQAYVDNKDSIPDNLYIRIISNEIRNGDNVFYFRIDGYFNSRNSTTEKIVLNSFERLVYCNASMIIIENGNNIEINLSEISSIKYVVKTFDLVTLRNCNIPDSARISIKYHNIHNYNSIYTFTGVYNKALSEVDGSTHIYLRDSGFCPSLENIVEVIMKNRTFPNYHYVGDKYQTEQLLILRNVPINKDILLPNSYQLVFSNEIIHRRFELTEANLMEIYGRDSEYRRREAARIAARRNHIRDYGRDYDMRHMRHFVLGRAPLRNHVPHVEPIRRAGIDVGEVNDADISTESITIFDKSTNASYTKATQECMVCYEKHSITSFKKLSCEHICCTECVNELYARSESPVCPLCRKAMPIRILKELLENLKDRDSVYMKKYNSK